MKLRTLAIITLVTALTTQLAYTQPKDPVYQKVEKALYSYFYHQGRMLMDNESFKDNVFMFGFAINVNEKGRVDSVWYSNNNSQLDSLLSLKSITKALVTSKAGFSEVKNSVLIGFVYLRRDWDFKISNTFQVDRFFRTIVPGIPEPYKSKKIQVLDAFSIVAVEGSRR